MSTIRPPVPPLDPDADPIEGVGAARDDARIRIDRSLDPDALAPAAGAAPGGDAVDPMLEALDVPSAGVVAGEPLAPPRRRHPIALKHYLWIVGAVAVVVLALEWLGSVLTPFLIGAILAYLGTPAVNRAERRGVPRAVSTLLVILFVAVLLAALFFVLIPLVQSEVVSVTRRVPVLFTQFTERVAPFLQDKFGITVALDFESIRSFISENAEEAQKLSLRLLSGVKA